MKITLLCSDQDHPVNSYLEIWVGENANSHDISLVREKRDLQGGDILFLVSCSEIIRPADRRKYKTCLVLHASDLPLGRGWSPHVWEIIGGAESLTLSLLEAEDVVDSGRIWKKVKIAIPQHALSEEINHKLFSAEMELMSFAVTHYDTVRPSPQEVNVEPTYYNRRSASDSEVDPYKSIVSQFDLIRVCDPRRFPAFFKHRGHKYKIVIEKINEE